jgi:hypothetical protein
MFGGLVLCGAINAPDSTVCGACGRLRPRPSAAARLAGVPAPVPPPADAEAADLADLFAEGALPPGALSIVRVLDSAAAEGADLADLDSRRGLALRLAISLGLA